MFLSEASFDELSNTGREAGCHRLNHSELLYDKNSLGSHSDLTAPIRRMLHCVA
jgi:hypothetical protein